MYAHDWVNWAPGHRRIKCPRSNCQMEKCTSLRQSAKDSSEAHRPVLSARRRLHLLLPSHWLAKSWFSALAIYHQVAAVWNQDDGHLMEGWIGLCESGFLTELLPRSGCSILAHESKRWGNVEAALRTILVQKHCLVEWSAHDKYSWLRWNEENPIIPVSFPPPILIYWKSFFTFLLILTLESFWSIVFPVFITWALDSEWTPQVSTLFQVKICWQNLQNSICPNA